MLYHQFTSLLPRYSITGLDSVLYATKYHDALVAVSIRDHRQRCVSDRFKALTVAGVLDSDPNILLHHIEMQIV